MLEIITLTLSVVLNLLLGMFVLAKSPRSTTHRAFFVTTLCIIGYSTANYLSLHPVFFSQLTLIRLDLFVAVPLFLFIYLTFNVFPHSHFQPPNRLRRFLTVYSLLVMPLVMSPLVFSRLDVAAGHVQPVPAPGIALFAIQQLGLLLAALLTILKRFRNSSGLLRVQYRFILAGIGLTFGFIILFNLVLVNAFKITTFVQFGSAATLFFTGAFTYAIARHRLLDIRAVVAKSVAYILLLITLAVSYGLAVFAVSAVLFPNEQLNLGHRVLNVVLAIVLAFTFQPLRRFFERLTGRIFFRDSYNSEEVLNHITQILAREIKLQPMLHETLHELCSSLHIENGLIMVFAEGKIYQAEHYGQLPDKLLTEVELRKLNRKLLVSDELGPGEAKDILDSHHIRVSLVMRTKEELVGCLVLGDKLSGDIYTNQDLDLLEILASELAVGIANAKAYDEIAHFNVTLQQKIDEATKRLRVANRNLKALDKAKDEFISMASHQLRTPLTTVKGYLSMILEGDTGKITKEQRQFLDYAFGGTERMVSLINDLLNVSRMSAGRFIIERKPTDLVAMVADEVRQLRSHADAKALKLEFEQPKTKPPLVELDEGKTRQVIMNFIDNAIYYTREGGVYVKLDFDKAASVVNVTVRDTGIGVPEDAKKKLFTKFFRADNAQATRPDGTGLGLYLAKRVVEDQGGTIIFESAQNQGSTFGFTIPVKLAPKVTKPTTGSGDTKVVVKV